MNWGRACYLSGKEKREGGTDRHKAMEGNYGNYDISHNILFIFPILSTFNIKYLNSFKNGLGPRYMDIYYVRL